MRNKFMLFVALSTLLGCRDECLSPILRNDSLAASQMVLSTKKKLLKQRMDSVVYCLRGWGHPTSGGEQKTSCKNNDTSWVYCASPSGGGFINPGILSPIFMSQSQEEEAKYCDAMSAFIRNFRCTSLRPDSAKFRTISKLCTLDDDLWSDSLDYLHTDLLLTINLATSLIFHGAVDFKITREEFNQHMKSGAFSGGKGNFDEILKSEYDACKKSMYLFGADRHILDSIINLYPSAYLARTYF